MPQHTLGESHFVTLHDGRRLHYQSQGSGGPTVVLEGGMGFSSAVWGMVAPKIARHVRTVVYDRAGAGKSDWDDADRTLDRMCDDLGQLLDELPGPFILVGYSWGGPIVRRMASRHEFDIRALVLINQTDERNSQYTYLARSKSRFFKVVVLWRMHTRGLVQAAWNVIRHMPSDCRREIMYRDIPMRGVRLFIAEGSEFLSGLMNMKDDHDRFAGLDIVVITGTDRDVAKSKYAPAMIRAQQETAEYVDRGTFVEAPNSAHYVLMTEPGIIVHQILKLLEKHRTV